MPGPLRRSTHVSFDDILQAEEGLQSEIERTMARAPGPPTPVPESSSAAMERQAEDGRGAAPQRSGFEEQSPEQRSLGPLHHYGSEPETFSSADVRETWISSLNQRRSESAEQPPTPFDLNSLSPVFNYEPRGGRLEEHWPRTSPVQSAAPTRATAPWLFVPAEEDHILSPPAPSPGPETSDDSDGLIMPPQQAHQHMNGRPRSPENLVRAAAQGHRRERSFNPGPLSESEASDVSRGRPRRRESDSERHATFLVRRYAALGDTLAQRRLRTYDRRMHSPLEGTVNVVDPLRPANSTDPVPHVFPPDYMRRALRAVEFQRLWNYENVITDDRGVNSSAEVIDGSFFRFLRERNVGYNHRSRTETEVAETMLMLHGRVNSSQRQGEPPEAPPAYTATPTAQAPETPGLTVTAGAPGTSWRDFAQFSSTSHEEDDYSHEQSGESSHSGQASQQQDAETSHSGQAYSAPTQPPTQRIIIERPPPELRERIRTHWQTQRHLSALSPESFHEYNMAEILNAVENHHQELLMEPPRLTVGLLEYNTENHWDIARRIAQWQLRQRLVLDGILQSPGYALQLNGPQTVQELVQSRDLEFYREGEDIEEPPEYQPRSPTVSWPPTLGDLEDTTRRRYWAIRSALEERPGPSVGRDTRRTSSVPPYGPAYPLPLPQPLPSNLRIPAAQPPQPERREENLAESSQRLDSIAHQGGVEGSVHSGGVKPLTNGHVWPNEEAEETV